MRKRLKNFPLSPNCGTWVSGHRTAANVLSARRVLGQPVHPELRCSHLAEALIVELAVRCAAVGSQDDAPLAQVRLANNRPCLLLYPL